MWNYEAHFAQSLLTLGIEWSAVDQEYGVLPLLAFGSASDGHLASWDVRSMVRCFTLPA